jgi:hypothetical protein
VSKEAPSPKIDAPSPKIEPSKPTTPPVKPEVVSPKTVPSRAEPSSPKQPLPSPSKPAQPSPQRAAPPKIDPMGSEEALTESDAKMLADILSERDDDDDGGGEVDVDAVLHAADNVRGEGGGGVLTCAQIARAQEEGAPLRGVAQAEALEKKRSESANYRMVAPLRNTRAVQQDILKYTLMASLSSQIADDATKREAGLPTALAVPEGGGVDVLLTLLRAFWPLQVAEHI